MGKPKKEKKNQDEDFGDDVAADDALAQEGGVKGTQPSSKKGKKGRKKKDDDWEDDIAGEIAALSMEVNAGVTDDVNEDTSSLVTNQKKKKKKTRKVQEDEEAEAEGSAGDKEDEPAMTADRNRSKMAAAFQMLNDEDSNEDKVPSDDEPPAEVKMTAATEESQSSQRKKGKKSKKKKAADDEEEEDIDAILAQIENRESSSEATVETVVAKKTEEGEEDDEGNEDDEEEMHTVKTAAQKKKEKKERQKQQKLQTKSKPSAQQKVEKVVEDAVPAAEAEETKTADTAGGAEEEAGDGGEDKKKKKDRKKKKKGEEEEKETKKKPTKMVRAMQEQLRKMQEEEEAHRRAEEERIRQEEEAQRQKEEAERLEKEKKEREKQKKKERVERLKAEGKFLTAKQKEAQRRAQQMLNAMREQGLDVPAIGERQDGEKKKRVVYSKKKKPPQQQQQQQQQQTEVVTPTSPEVEEVPQEPTKDEILDTDAKKKEDDDVKASWDESDDDTKDAWDASDDDEEKEVTTTAIVVEEKGPEKTTKPAEPAPSDDTKKDADDEDESADEDDEESSEEESSDEDENEESSDEDDGLTVKERARERALARMAKRREEADKKRSTDVLRAAVVCVLGHVDTGKTKILDKLRRTNVQDGEAGGITQQIGATNVPYDAIREQTKMCKEFAKQDLKLPGLLIIDTPGHESFSNLRSRGSSLCDIAILVVDIMHGLEPQTIESLNLLKQRKTPFVVALNKVDRLFQWQSNPHNDIMNTIKKQKANTKLEFDERLSGVVVQFAEQGLNAAPFYENKNVREYVSLVPTSAHTGDGIGNLIALICELSQTLLAKRISYSEELQATAMEVKALPGLGTTVDVILVNGALKEGETVVLAGTEGAIVTQIRGLLMPHPMKEMRVKTNFEHHKVVAAAQGVKVIAKDLEKALAGLPVFVARQPDEVEILKEEIESVLKDVLASIKLQERGVFVQASTLGSLEALLEFLNTSNIPYAGINIGPVHKKDIMKASIMLEHDNQFAVILAFDVKVEREAQELADSVGVTIFSADIIYHLFDAFMAHRERLKRERQDQYRHIAVFPCKLRVMPQFIFNSRDPIVMGVSVEAGFVAVGTPICVPSKEFVELGRVASLELNHKSIDRATRGQEVCIKIEPLSSEAPKMYGRHFEATDMLISKISRQSIDAVKDYFRDDMTKSDWQLMVELKKLFEIL